MAYLIKALSEKHRGLSVYKKELLAIVIELHKWRPYLLGRHFKLKLIIKVLKFCYNKDFLHLLNRSE